MFICIVFQVAVNRLGGRFGTCADITAENHTRNVYEEVYDDVINYSMMVSSSWPSYLQIVHVVSVIYYPDAIQ